MKRKLASVMIVGGLLFSGLGVAGAAEVKPSPLKGLNDQRKSLNVQLKAQTTLNQKAREEIKNLVPQEVKNRVKQTLSEVKALRAANKTLLLELKAAKAAKDSGKATELKAQITANHGAINTKLTSIKAELEQLKVLHAKVKAIKLQTQPIHEKKKSHHDAVKQKRTSYQSLIAQAKESRKQKNEAALNNQLAEAASLLEQIIALKKEILVQKTQIGSLLK